MRNEKMAKFLLEIGAIELNLEKPFIWTSGIKSPIYCDNRLILGNHSVWEFAIDGLKKIIADKFPEVEAIAGVATAGIPHAAVIGYGLKLPTCYVRPEPKKHGQQNQIEGMIPSGKNVVVIEDLISTGKSSLEAVKCLEDAGCKVLGVVALFSYETNASIERFEEKKVPLYALCNLKTLSKVATEHEFIKEEEMKEIIEFGKNPVHWRDNLEILKQKEFTSTVQNAG